MLQRQQPFVTTIELLVVLQDQLHKVRAINEAEIALRVRERTRLFGKVAKRNDKRIFYVSHDPQGAQAVIR
jgi:hypothetical protein